MRGGGFFSGIGGFELAMQRAGIELAFMCEIELHAQKVLKKHFPHTKLIEDVKQVRKKSHGRNPIDIITGGFPCQDLSIAGKRKGLAGERSGLWYEFARVIDEFEPKWAVIENVAGLLSSNKGEDLAVILYWLAKRGYGVAYRVFDAQYFGVAQRRRRVFIVASFGNGSAAKVLFESESLPGNTSEGGETGKETAYTLRANASHSGDKGDGGINTTLIANTVQAQEAKKSNSPQNQHTGIGVLQETVGALQVLDKKGIATTIDDKLISIPIHDKATRHKGGGNTRNDDGAGNGINIGKENDPMYTLGAGDRHMVFQQNTRDEVRLMGGDGHYAGALAAQAGMKQQNYVWEMQHASEGYRETEAGISPTLQTRMGTGGNQVPLVGVRRLTPLECERLQGFPEEWTAGQADSHRYEQLGNAVAVPVVEWIINRIVKEEAENEKRR